MRAASTEKAPLRRGEDEREGGGGQTAGSNTSRGRDSLPSRQGLFGTRSDDPVSFASSQTALRQLATSQAEFCSSQAVKWMTRYYCRVQLVTDAATASVFVLQADKDPQQPADLMRRDLT